MVVATEDNTGVQVRYVDNGDVTLPDEELTLNKHEVFTRDAYHHDSGSPEIDFTGTYISADKPVAVYSGHGTVYLSAPVSHLD